MAALQTWVWFHFVGAKNNYVNITINASTPFPEASCQILCGFDRDSIVKCNISYSTDATEIGQPASPIDAPIVNGSLGETLSFPLTEPLPPNTTYYYQVVAFSADQRITVNGNFSTGNYSGGISKYCGTVYKGRGEREENELPFIAKKSIPPNKKCSTYVV